MNIASFRRELAASAIGPGAHWRKADFHIHVPGSSDYEYRAVDAFERLGQALSSTGCDFAVVLKHQEFPSREEIRRLQAHCPKTTLIPGAEINVLVDALFKKIGKDYFFHCIVAVDPAQDGDYGYLLRRAQEEFTYRPGDYPAGFRSSILDLGNFFRSNNALFIPAHLHQSKSPETSRSIDDLYEDDAFLGFVKAGAFDALEVRQRKTAAFFDGNKLTAEGLPIPPSVCVSSTDAHHHDHVLQRQRGTWVRVECSTFAELSSALHFPHRVSLDAPQVAHSRIVGMHVVGTFVPESWFSFSEGLNAFIGSKGSGKTALLECLRFALNTPVPSDRVDSIKRHLVHILGSAGYVECLVVREDGSELLITRRADSPDRISILDQSDQTQTVNATDSLSFPISILGWHEIEAVADKATARMTLVDSIGDPLVIKTFQHRIGEQVERARDLLPLLQRQVKKLDGSLRELWDLQRKRSALARLQQGDLLTLQEQYEWFLLTEQKLAALKEAATKKIAAVPDAISSGLSVELQASPDQDSVGAAAAPLAMVREALTHNEDIEKKGSSDLQEGLSAIAHAVDAAVRELTKAFALFRDTVYTPKVNALPPEDREVLAKQIQVLEETKRLPVVERECGEMLRALKSSASELSASCESICALRDEIVAVRENTVDGLNRDLTGVKLQFRRSTNHEARDHFQSRYGAEATTLVGYLQKFGNAEGYQNLMALFRKLGELEITQDRWEVEDTLWDVKFVEFLSVLDDDDVEISLEVGRAGFVPIQNLSAGQRCVAVFPLLLRNSRGPLVIDQPEEKDAPAVRSNIPQRESGSAH
jgi:DNA repair ATPase RecN